MARVQNTLIGRASGSVGQVEFLTWKGINVTRAKPMSVVNPNTVFQQTYRDLYGQMVGYYRQLLPFLKFSFKTRNRKMTIFNYFQKQNMPHAFLDNGDGTVTLIPKNLIISKGLLPNFRLLSSTIRHTGQDCTFLWSSAIGNGRSFSDKLSIILFCVETKEFQVNQFVAQRNTTLVNIPVTINISAGNTVYYYMVFSSPDGKLIQDAKIESKVAI